MCDLTVLTLKYIVIMAKLAVEKASGNFQVEFCRKMRSRKKVAK